MAAELSQCVSDGLFRQRLFEKSTFPKTVYATVDGMLKAAKQKWQNIPLKMFQDSLSSWSGRVLGIHKARGHDVPQ